MYSRLYYICISYTTVYYVGYPTFLILLFITQIKLDRLIIIIIRFTNSSNDIRMWYRAKHSCNNIRYNLQLDEYTDIYILLSGISSRLLLLRVFHQKIYVMGGIRIYNLLYFR